MDIYYNANDINSKIKIIREESNDNNCYYEICSQKKLWNTNFKFEGAKNYYPTHRCSTPT